MKAILRILLFLALALIVTAEMFAQSAPPPPPGHGETGNQPVGGDSPIGAGIGFLLLMAGGYGAKKVYDARKKLQE